MRLNSVERRRAAAEVTSNRAFTAIEQEQQARAEKTERLRALRLAREAKDAPSTRSGAGSKE